MKNMARTAALAVAITVAAGMLIAQETGWVKMADVPTTANLYAVTGVSKTKAWAGGEKGTLLMWDGEKWNIQELPDPTTYKGTQHAQRDGIFITDIWMFNESDGWAVGHFLHRTGRIYRWNGVKWSLHTTLEADYSDLVNVAFLSPTNGFAVASHGRCYAWNGRKWDSSNYVVYLATVNEDVEASPTDGMYWIAAVSEWGNLSDNNDSRDTVGFFRPMDRGVKEIDIPNEPFKSDVSELFALPTGEIFYMHSHKNVLRTISQSGNMYSLKGFAYQFDVKDGLRNFWMLNGHEGWFIGNSGLVSHYQGNAKTGPRNVNTYPTNQRLTDIWMLDKDFGFIVGDGGTILRHPPPASVRLSMAWEAYAFEYRALASFSVTKESSGAIAESEGRWNIKTKDGKLVIRTDISYRTIADTLNAGRPLKLAWNQNGDDGRPAGPGEYVSEFSIGDTKVSVPFIINPPASDKPDIVGASGGLNLAATPVYAINVPVTFTVANKGSQPVDFSGAQYLIERLVNGSWRRYYHSAAGFLGSLKLGPGKSKAIVWPRSNTQGTAIAPPGKYRVTLKVPAATSDSLSNEFTLE